MKFFFLLLVSYPLLSFPLTAYSDDSVSEESVASVVKKMGSKGIKKFIPLYGIGSTVVSAEEAYDKIEDKDEKGLVQNTVTVVVELYENEKKDLEELAENSLILNDLVIKPKIEDAKKYYEDVAEPVLVDVYDSGKKMLSDGLKNAEPIMSEEYEKAKGLISSLFK